MIIRCMTALVAKESALKESLAQRSHAGKGSFKAEVGVRDAREERV